MKKQILRVALALWLAITLLPSGISLAEEAAPYAYTLPLWATDLTEIRFSEKVEFVYLHDDTALQDMAYYWLDGYEQGCHMRLIAMKTAWRWPPFRPAHSPAR